MSRAKKELTADHLPQLGVAPYVELMDSTATSETDRQSASLGLMMMWLGDHIMDAMDLDLAPYSITESKLDLLLLLTLHVNRERVTPSALADRLGIRRASVTTMLDWLEKRNWVLREPSAGDGRMLHVKITAEGRALIDQVLPVFWAACASFMADLEPEEQRVLEKILLKLNRSMENRLGVGR